MHRHRAEIEALTDCYAIAMIRVAGLSAACARHDHVDARLAAWLLRLSDYAESDQFAVTHERTAEMLGARRASVTAAYNALKRDGAIRVSRKHVEIVEPERLRRVACSCRIHARATIDAVYRGGGTDGKRCAL
jgi:CRP-like cAMP-binding protein